MVEVQVLAHSNKPVDITDYDDDDDNEEAVVSTRVVTESSRSDNFVVKTRKVGNRSAHSIVLVRNTGQWDQSLLRLLVC
jgi:hypothetical protein